MMSGIPVSCRTVAGAAVRVLQMAGVAVWLSGCAAISLSPEERPEAIPVPELASEVEVLEPAKAQAPALESTLAIIVGAEYAGFRAQSFVFAARLGRPYRLYELSARSPQVILRDLHSNRPDSVIALGPSALNLAAGLEGVDLVYAGVLYPEAGNQIAYRGVEALPPFGLQLDYWRTTVADLERIGVIGSGLSRERVEEIARACKAAGVQLDHREVASDREMLLAFRSMLPHIDGFVLLPDPKILSPEVISRAISHGVVNDLPLLVYSPLMYELGASLFIEPEPVDVALQVIALLASNEKSRRLTKLQTRSRSPHPTVAFDG